MSISQIEETYHGFYIYGEALSSMGDYDGWLLTVEDEKHTLQFILQSKVSRSAALTNTREVARDNGLHRSRGMIDLREYELGKEYEHFVMTYSVEETAKTDEQVRQLLLKALYNIYRAQPTRAKFEQIDVKGFCSVLGISKSSYEFNAAVLIDKGYVSESPLQQLSIAEGGIYISPAGIDKVEAAVQSGIGTYDEMLALIAQLEKRTPGQYVDDRIIVQESGLEIQDVRDWIDVLEAEGLVQTANSFDGYCALLTARGRLLLKGTPASLQATGLGGLNPRSAINVTIQTSGGAFIAGDAQIGGDFTGRDRY